MKFNNQKYLPWTAKNYFATIFTFFIHLVVICGLVLLSTMLYAGGKQGLIDFFNSKETLLNWVNLLVAFVLLFITMYFFLYYEFRDIIIDIKNINVIFVIIEVSIIASVLMGHYVNIYARPIALCALLVLLLINKRTAVFINICYSTMMFLGDYYTNSGFATNIVVSSFIMSLTVSHIAIHLVDKGSSRIKVFLMGFVISLPMIITILLLEYHLEMTIAEVIIDGVYGLMGGVLSVVGLMAILPIFEALFNIVTNYRLVELCDHKSPLIRKMIEEAGGTFQHSIIVATLAETCASAIGENPVVARAAAYYHDVGKLKQPEYFTENQHGYNPHDDLTPELSTEIIRSHANDGYDLIKKYHLPIILADVAREHHGTLPIQYFYAKAIKFTEGDLDIANFSYQGPKPSTKIAAIIMLCDGCEAAVRANADRSREKVEKTVDAIFNNRMELNQFANCDLTMNDIDIIKTSIVNTLSGVYHDRINYPKIRSNKQ